MKSKVVAGILGILFGGLGIHKFYLGYTKEAVIMLAIWIVGWITLGIVPLIMNIVGIIEGIMYLTKSDDDFQSIYVQGHKGWF